MRGGRSPRRVQRAMENGFLNARSTRGPECLRDYGFWCWRMGLPMIWIEPCSRYSRFSRVRLDLFTTPFTLTISGRAALIAIAAGVTPAQYASITAHGAEWNRVPNHLAADFARTILRVVRRPVNYEIQKQAVPISVWQKSPASTTQVKAPAPPMLDQQFAEQGGAGIQPAVRRPRAATGPRLAASA
jgi:hypothetical protein